MLVYICSNPHFSTYQRSERRSDPAVQLHDLHHHLDALVSQQAAHPHLSHVLQVGQNLAPSYISNFEMLIRI